MLDKEIIKDFLQNKNFVMFISSVFFMCGILAYFAQKEILSAFIITIILSAALLLKIFDIKRVIILVFIFYFGFTLTFCKVKNTDNLVTKAPVNGSFYGRIISIPNSAQHGQKRFFFETEKLNNEAVKGKTLVTISADESDLSKLNIGDKVLLNGNLRRPFKATNPSQFDYGNYLKNFNTFTVLYANDDFKITKKENKSFKWKFLGTLNNTRNSILKIHSKYLKSPNLEILGGIVFGDDAVAPPDYIKNSFIHSGLLHILAASGMNVAFIFWFWTAILQFIKIPYRARTISGMFIVILYTLMTGLGASVIRAALMLLFVLAGKLIDRDAHSISLLSLVAVLMLIYNPAYINDVGFQLSFMVTFGLFTTADVISKKFDMVPDKLEWLKAGIIIPLCAQIWVAPIQMFYFNTFSLYSIFANICAACFVSAISFIGFISSILAIFKPIADTVCMIFDYFVNYLLNILVHISDFFSNLPNCLLQTTHPNIIQIIIYYIMILSVTYLIKYDKYKKAFITFISISLILLVTNISIVSKNLEIISFDVGNADSFLVKTPQNKYFFIDTGKAPYKSGNSQAKIIMLKYLKDRGIKNIQGIIVTHFDNDHSGGTVDILTETNVENLYLNSKDATTQTAKNIFTAIKKLDTNTHIAENNQTIYTEPELKIQTYKANISGKDASNGCSIITLISYKDFDMLFMGDAGAESFERVKQNIPHNIEILKVGHHGGANVVNQDMLNHLGNKISLISTGINYFGHPNKGTLDLLRHTHIIRTDYLNAIKISTDGKLYQIYSYDIHDKKFKIKEKFLSKNPPNGGYN